ncbi:MAG TPA: GNAT family N-acetyltransferase [Bryobacteraceae bacterium]|nr:GNAT family N-acetyltransferase [Bryobacteraceae bacterium]
MAEYAVKMIKLEPIHLNFLFGSRHIFSFFFLGYVYPKFFTDTPSALTKTIEDAIPCGTDVALMMDRPVSRELPKLTKTSNVLQYVPRQNPRYYIDITNDVPACFARPSAKSRRELARKLRKFEEACGDLPVVREYRLPGEMPAFHRLVREVSLKTTHGHLIRRFAGTEKFQRDLIQMAEQRGVRGYILFHGERPVAFEYCRILGDVLTGEMCGYDPEFAKWSPGAVLLYALLRKASQEGEFRLFDFGPGYAPYKELIATGEVLCADVFYFRQTIPHLAAVTTHSAFLSACRFGAKVLELMGLRSRGTYPRKSLDS